MDRLLKVFEDEDFLKVGSQSYIDGPKCYLLPLDLVTFLDKAGTETAGYGT
jgi:hypothetical protein